MFSWNVSRGQLAKGESTPAPSSVVLVHEDVRQPRTCEEACHSRASGNPEGKAGSLRSCHRYNLEVNCHCQKRRDVVISCGQYVLDVRSM